MDSTLWSRQIASFSSTTRVHGLRCSQQLLLFRRRDYSVAQRTDERQPRVPREPLQESQWQQLILRCAATAPSIAEQKNGPPRGRAEVTRDTRKTPSSAGGIRARGLAPTEYMTSSSKVA